MLTSYQPLPLHPSISVGQVGQEFTSYFLPMTSTDVPDDLSHRPITMGVQPVKNKKDDTDRQTDSSQDAYDTKIKPLSSCIANA